MIDIVALISSSEISLAGTIFLGLAVLLILTRLFRGRKGKKVPEIENGLPFFGQVFTMVKGSPWDTMAAWAGKYGTLYKLHLFGSEAYVVSNPEFLKIILSTKLSAFKKDVHWTYKPFLPLLGNGLVTAEGDSWFKQRKLLSSHLRLDILDDIPNITIEAVKRLKPKLDRYITSGESLEMAEQFRHLTLQVIAEAILSLHPDESDRTFAKMYLPIVEEGNLRTWSPQRMYIPMPSWFQFRAAVKKLDDYVSGLITVRWDLRNVEEREKEGKKGKKEGSGRKQDVLDKVLSNIPSSEWNKSTLKQVQDEMKTFILAGHETSASMLTWSLYELLINPTCMEKVRAEAKLIYSGRSDDNPPGRSDVETLIYTECCLRESLRKYSVVPSVVRVSQEAMNLGEYHIEKGATMMLNIQGVHHDKQFWPEPLKYKPERFLKQEEILPFTFLPFIDGPRMCLGQYLSLLESKMVLSWLVHNYDFELDNANDAGLKHPFMVPIIPKVGHNMKIKARK